MRTCWINYCPLFQSCWKKKIFSNTRTSHGYYKNLVHIIKHKANPSTIKKCCFLLQILKLQRFFLIFSRGASPPVPLLQPLKILFRPPLTKVLVALLFNAASRAHIFLGQLPEKSVHTWRHWTTTWIVWFPLSGQDLWYIF